VSDLRSLVRDIYQKHGELTAELYVEEATPEDSPLHGTLPWDDMEAARAHRLHVAAGIIRSLKIAYGTDKQGRKKTTREYLNVTHQEDPDRRSYVPTAEIVPDDLQLQRVHREAEREWKQFRAKYGHLKEFSEIVRLGSQESA
jgi:hypothetical protein